MKREKHVITKYGGKPVDCCGDRYECNIDYVCSCGVRYCESCMQSHLMTIHFHIYGPKPRNKLTK